MSGSVCDHTVLVSHIISKCDVSSVTGMDHMFTSAVSFKQELCGFVWVHSKTTKEGMFEGSFDSLSLTACEIAVFLPKSKAELQSAVRDCLKLGYHPIIHLDS